MKTILITGGAGFIGTNLISMLLSIGYDVYSLDNYSTGFKTNEISGCKYFTGDINNINKMRFTSTNKFDVIFHLAALARIQPSFENPIQVFESNISGTSMVLEFARLNGAKVIFAGSSSRWHNPEESPYAMSKYIGEQLCKMYAKSYKMDVQIARFYNVYGPKEITEGDYATILGIWRKKRRLGEPLSIYGDGQQRRDFTHVFDICNGLCLIMDTDIKDIEWDLGTGVNYSINEICDIFGTEREYLPDRKHNYKETIRKDDSTLTLLNWKPQDRIKEYIDQDKNNT